MTRIYKLLIRPVLFRFDPERIHELVARLLCLPFAALLLRLLYRRPNPGLKRTVFGISFDNPIGVAAGFDKNAELIRPLAAIGFGFTEIGTVTPEPQPGNPRPRLFRLPADRALINRMGFNNKGAEAIRGNLSKKRPRIIVGGNIGKNKQTPNDQAAEDYLKCFEALYDHVDYFVVNVSSPNTPGLRELQEGAALRQILGRLKSAAAAKRSAKPILLKIAPDLTNEQLDEIIAIVRETGTDGIVATNTTITRSELLSPPEKVAACGEGGLSGVPLRERSTEIIRYLVEKTNREVPVIGVGGIFSPEDALEKLDAGASLIQLYTGFIYEGPGIVKKINRAILGQEKRH